MITPRVDRRLPINIPAYVGSRRCVGCAPARQVVTDHLAERLDVAKGDSVRVAGSGGRAETLTVLAVRGQGMLSGSGDVATTERDLRRLFVHPGVTVVLAEGRTGVDPSRARAAVERATAGAQNVAVGGAAEIKSAYTNVLDTLLLIVSALLGVAVLIAFVGVANTLALSVIERRRESALLRALGLTGGQQRAMFSGEAVLMAVVGGLLGVVLGIVFGWAAVASLFPTSVDVVLTVPVTRVVLFAVASGVAGLLASAPPARRATRAPVASGLAEE